MRLPAIHRAFLGRMGRSTGRFLLARGYDHDFDTVTRGLPTSAYPQHLFKIAAPNDQHVTEDGTAAAYFLDLTGRADSYFLRRGDEDGALVMGRVGAVLELLCRSRDVFDRFPDAHVSAPGPRPAYNARAFRFS